MSENEATSAAPPRSGWLAWTAAPAGAVSTLLLLPVFGAFAALLGLALALTGVGAAIGRVAAPSAPAAWLALLWSLGWALLVVVVCLMLNGVMGHWH